MPAKRENVTGIVRRIREHLRRGGSSQHAAGVQWFFNEEVRSHGWYTADLRRFARAQARAINSAELLFHVADHLFSGNLLEEKIVGVLLLERSIDSFGNREFRRMEKWLDRVSSWADHDALVHYLLGRLILADHRRALQARRWAKSRNRWRRRAAAVALIHPARQRVCFQEIVRVSEMLLEDRDEMVQKGLGWLLRECAKADRKRAVPLLTRIARRAPRLVLRTACETLPGPERRRILGKPGNRSAWARRVRSVSL